MSLRGVLDVYSSSCTSPLYKGLFCTLPHLYMYWPLALSKAKLLIIQQYSGKRWPPEHLSKAQGKRDATEWCNSILMRNNNTSMTSASIIMLSRKLIIMEEGHEGSRDMLYHTTRLM